MVFSNLRAMIISIENKGIKKGGLLFLKIGSVNEIMSDFSPAAGRRDDQFDQKTGSSVAESDKRDGFKLKKRTLISGFFGHQNSNFLLSGKRKRIAFANAAVGRLFWVAILTVAHLSVLSSGVKYIFVLGLIFISHSFIRDKEFSGPIVIQHPG